MEKFLIIFIGHNFLLSFFMLKCDCIEQCCFFLWFSGFEKLFYDVVICHSGMGIVILLDCFNVRLLLPLLNLTLTHFKNVFVYIRHCDQINIKNHFIYLIWVVESPRDYKMYETTYKTVFNKLLMIILCHI